MIPALFIVAALASLLPGVLASFHGTEAAWDNVFHGLETMCLWLAVSRYMSGRFRWAGLAVCCYGVFESSQRWACRIVLPMDKPPSLPNGIHLCDAAGVPMTVLSPLAICLVAVVVASNR